METKDVEQCSELMEDAKQLKNSLNLEDINTAILLLMYDMLIDIKNVNE